MEIDKQWVRRKMPALVFLWRCFQAGRCFRYDKKRLLKHSSYLRVDTPKKLVAQIAMGYHVVEKGLTMPARRMGFGQEKINKLMLQIHRYEKTYGPGEPQVVYAVGVLRAYWDLHKDWEGKKRNPAFWQNLEGFLRSHPDIPPARQLHFTRESYFGALESPFPAFALSRHSVRHYGPGEIPVERIRAAVALAISAPSACNRQYVRVHCLSSKPQIASILAIQGGNRGFGHLADKLLVVTADLEGTVGEIERNDLFANGGIFVMNLSYALHYNKIVHCILNWSKSPREDRAMRRILSLRPSENVVAVLTCGEAPEEFDVAASPRRTVDEILVMHAADKSNPIPGKME